MRPQSPNRSLRRPNKQPLLLRNSFLCQRARQNYSETRFVASEPARITPKLDLLPKTAPSGCQPSYEPSIAAVTPPFGIIAHRRDEATGGLYARWGYGSIRRTEFARTRLCLRSWLVDSLSLLPSLLPEHRKDRRRALGRRFRGRVLRVRHHVRPVRRGRARHGPALDQAGHFEESPARQRHTRVDWLPASLVCPLRSTRTRPVYRRRGGQRRILHRMPVRVPRCPRIHGATPSNAHCGARLWPVLRKQPLLSLPHGSSSRSLCRFPVYCNPLRPTPRPNCTNRDLQRSRLALQHHVTCTLHPARTFLRHGQLHPRRHEPMVRHLGHLAPHTLYEPRQHRVRRSDGSASGARRFTQPRRLL